MTNDKLLDSNTKTRTSNDYNVMFVGLNKQYVLLNKKVKIIELNFNI